MTIEQRDFSAGWIPSDDAYNGRKNGLLRMDNLILDENGALTSARGITPITTAPLAALPHTLFSRNLGANFYRYAALADGSVFRDTNRANTFGTSILTGGGIKRASFISALNQIFIASGTKTVKDNGGVIYPVGLVTPLAPTVIAETTQSTINLENFDGGGNYTNWLVDTGTLITNASTYINFSTDVSTYQAIIRTIFATPKDLTSFPNGGYSLNSDLLQFYFQVGDATQLQSIRIEFLTYDPGASPSVDAPIAGSYYYYQWTINDIPEPWTSNQWNLISARRDQFLFGGANTQNVWANVKAIRVIAITNAGAIPFNFDELNFQGGSNAALNGNYRYYQQNGYLSGGYSALSPISLGSKSVQITNNRAYITPYTTGLEAQVNSIRIYRLEVNTQSVPTLVTTLSLPYSSFYDGKSDIELLTFSNIQANFFLVSLQNIPDPILGMVGLFFGRMLYFTASRVYISELLNPDAYDNRLILGYSGNSSEQFLWAIKVSNSVIYVGTTADIYEFSGTLSINPDGTLNANMRPLGVSYPPVSEACVADSGSVIYQSNDGWRILGGYGNDSQVLSQGIDLLYKKYARYGVPAVLPNYADTVLSRCTLNKNRFYAITYYTDATFGIHVYDITRKSWYRYLISAGCLFTEEDGTLIAGFNNNNNLSIIDNSNSPNTLIRGLFPIQDGGLPNQRKDCYTIKLIVDTGGLDVTLNLYANQASAPTASVIVNSNGLREIFIDCPQAVSLCKSVQFEIIGYVTVFKLTYIGLEAEPRPVQLTRLISHETNDNVSNAKRRRVLPFIIDTLGNNVSITPYVDNVPYPTVIFKNSYVKTESYYFQSDVIGTDFKILIGDGTSLFEFYRIMTGVDVQILPNGKLWDQIGPFDLNRFGYLERMLIRAITTIELLTYRLFAEDTLIYTGTITTQPNLDKNYEIVFPRGYNGTTARIELSATSPIYRFSTRIKIRATGMQTDGKWITA